MEKKKTLTKGAIADHDDDEKLRLISPLYLSLIY